VIRHAVRLAGQKRAVSYGDPRLYALSGVAEQLPHSNQPLVPERVFLAGSNGENGHGNGSSAAAGGMLGLLVSLLVAEKSGFQTASGCEPEGLKELTDRLLRQAVENIEPAESAAAESENLPVAKR